MSANLVLFVKIILYGSGVSVLCATVLLGNLPMKGQM